MTIFIPEVTDNVQCFLFFERLLLIYLHGFQRNNPSVAANIKCWISAIGSYLSIYMALNGMIQKSQEILNVIFYARGYYLFIYIVFNGASQQLQPISNVIFYSRGSYFIHLHVSKKSVKANQNYYSLVLHLLVSMWFLHL